MPSQILLYFDNSVIDPIARQNVGGRVKTMLNKHGARAFASWQNLVEAVRIPDEVERAKFVRTLLQVARDREEDPILYQAARAAVAQMRIHHPDWLVRQPDHRAIQKSRDQQRDEWRHMMQDATHVPRWMRGDARFFREGIGGSMSAQRAQREFRLGGAAVASPIIDSALAARIEPLEGALSAPDHFWRMQSAVGWWRGAFQGDIRRSEMRDYLVPHLSPRQIDPEAWIRFWLAEVDAAAVPVTRVKGLVGYFQSDKRVEAGNWGDINHAASAVGRDLFLTADRAFYQTLVKVRGALLGTGIAAPLLVNRAAPDIYVEIKTVLKW